MPLATNQRDVLCSEPSSYLCGQPWQFDWKFVPLLLFEDPASGLRRVAASLFEKERHLRLETLV